MRSRSCGLASMGTRSLSCRLTPQAPTSPSMATASTGDSVGRTASPHGSRPRVLTVQRPKENLCSGGGVEAGMGLGGYHDVGGGEENSLVFRCERRCLQGMLFGRARFFVSGGLIVKRIGMGIVGAGFVGPHHVDAVRRLGFVDVVAVAGSSQASADKKAEALGARKAYGSYEALLNDPDIQVVHNATPNYLHYPVNAAAIAKGKNVVSDKPLAMTAAEAKKHLA